MERPIVATSFIAVAKAASARVSPKNNRLAGFGTPMRKTGGKPPSAPTGPAMAARAENASSVVKAKSETQSRDRQAGTTPTFDTRPRLGFNPTMLLSPAGTRPEPAVSVPSASETRPAATATADPELEPPGLRLGSNGLRGT